MRDQADDTQAVLMMTDVALSERTNARLDRIESLHAILANAADRNEWAQMSRLSKSGQLCPRFRADRVISMA
jgi:hypothetical protein